MASANAAQAQPAYPAKPVRVVVPVASGGGQDIVARLLAAKLSDDLKQQFVVDNRSGAAGIIGTEIVAKAPADGYTLLMQNSGLSYMPSLYARLPFNVLNDFSAVSLIAATPSVLVVHPSVAAMSVKELIALMKARPGQLNYGAFVGGTLHLAMALFEDMAGVKATMIPYKGGGPALVDAAGGQVQMMIVPIVSAIGYVKGNRLRALGTSGARRAALLPEVPTIAEAGVPGYLYTTWYGLVAPAATPQAVIARLNQSVAKALTGGDLRSKAWNGTAKPVRPRSSRRCSNATSRAGKKSSGPQKFRGNRPPSRRRAGVFTDSPLKVVYFISN